MDYKNISHNHFDIQISIHTEFSSIALRTGVPILRKIGGFEKSLSLKRAFKRRQIMITLSVIHRWKADTFFFKKKEK